MLRRSVSFAAALICAAAVLWVPIAADAQTALPPIADKVHGLTRIDGFVTMYWDESKGQLWLDVPLDTDMIYRTALPEGVGSNDIGLDRGQPGETKLVRFVRRGPKVLLLQPNLAFRSDASDPDVRRAVTESFATSVLWGFTAEASSDGHVLVDGSEFALHDAHGVIAALKRADQGDYMLSPARSAIDPDGLKAFPRNTVIDALMTFTGSNPGRYVNDVAPTPTAITVRERQEFIALPEPGYVPRRSLPGCGFFDLAYTDSTAPLGDPVEQRFIVRHRLEKKDPGAARSEAVKPIVYYVDRGAPEPVRTALVEGASWWNAAFEAAGFVNAFRVEVLPAGADPLDVRYNVIEWAHRATRGWSYGDAIADPRTGEIIQGHVTLGALRMRQDYLIGEGLLSPYARGDERPKAIEAMVLARLRQLAAHELGHTLGLAHNFIASAEGRASVMDYPPPVVALTPSGGIDLGDAYATGIGAWDKVSITYGYRTVPDEATAGPRLAKVLSDARARGLLFLTDQDARPTGSAHPQTHLWDSGSNAVSALQHEMAVRRAALARFGEASIRTGMPLATMEDVLVPLYLHHRYQAEAATKLIGGEWYSYALRGDGQLPLHPVAGADQLRALDAVLATVAPDALALPTVVLKRIPPRPFTYDATRELFPRWTGLVFDRISPAAAAADMTFVLLFDPERASRLVEQHAIDPGLPDLDAVLGRATARVFGVTTHDGYRAEIARTVQRSMVDRLMDLAADAPMAQVRAEATAQLRAIRARMLDHLASDRAEAAHRRLIADDIGRFVDRPFQPAQHHAPVEAPPGSPIGEMEPL
jgi:hypothetical protein